MLRDTRRPPEHSMEDVSGPPSGFVKRIFLLVLKLLKLPVKHGLKSENVLCYPYSGYLILNWQE
jgi:hypothetical protein